MMRLSSLTTVLGACAVLTFATDTPAQGQQTDAMLNSTIRLRESRAAAKLELLKATDARLEQGIEELVTLLQSVNDSPESRTRVTQLKDQVSSALANSIGYYRQRREATRAAMERPDLGHQPEDLRRGLAALDERIERRIAQIIDLTRSLEVHQEFERHLIEYSRNNRGWGDNRSFRRNPDWQQNRRVTTLTDQERRQVEAALAGDIADLDRRERDLRSRMTTATGVTRELLEEDLEDVQRRQGIRTHQLSEVRIPTASEATNVDLRRARELQALVSDMTDDLREDFFTTFRLYNELLAERRDIAQLRARVGG